MPIEQVPLSFFDFSINAALTTKLFLVLFLIFYSIFALILYRQVQLMNNKLPTILSPILSFVSTVHIGASLAVLFLIIGAF